MRIIACIKQIPDLSNISVSRSQEMIFEKGPRIMNKIDEGALELALSLKDNIGCEVVTLTLGSDDCINSLKTYLAAGADKAYLLSDAAFQGGDPASAAIALAEAIKKIGEFGLIMAGTGSITGNRGQTSGRIAEYIDTYYLSNVKHIERLDDRYVVRHTFDGEERNEDLFPPAVVACIKDIKPLRIPAGLAIMKAAKKEIIKFSPQDLGLSENVLGEKGAATRLVMTRLGKL